MNLLMYDVNKEQRERNLPENERRTVVMKKMISLILVLALALCMVPVFAEEEAAEEEVSELALMTYAEYAEAELDAPVYVETYVQATQSWWDDKITVYAQNEEGACFIYNMACSKEDAEKLVPGTKIAVKGYKAEWSGEVEITEATFEFVDADPFIAEAEDIGAILGTDDLIEAMNKKIAIKGAKVVPYTTDGAEINEEIPFAYDWDNSGSRDKNGVGADLYFKVEVNGAAYTMTVESYLCNNETDAYKAVEALKVGDVIDLEGFLYWYNGANPHITKVVPAA